MGQSHQNFELIIVDDGSSDGTVEYLEEKYEEKIKEGKIKIIRAPHGGVCLARNLGLKATTKEWIAYADSDNKVVPSFLEKFAISIVENAKYKVFYA